MSNELIAIVGIGVTLAGLNLYNYHYLRADVQSLREETQAQFKAQRAENQAEFKALREEMRLQREETRAEFKAQREETQAESKAQREETRAEFKTQREETQAEFKAQREAINGLQGRMVRLEQRMTHLEALFKGQRVALEIPGSG